MKNWFTWMLVMAGLVFVFAFWPVPPPSAQADEKPASPSAPTVHRAEHHRKSPATPPATSPAARFGEYPCNSTDCEGHKAGFRWAQDHATADPDDCTGNSGAFIEGCRVYVEKNSQVGWIDPLVEGSQA